MIHDVSRKENPVAVYPVAHARASRRHKQQALTSLLIVNQVAVVSDLARLAKSLYVLPPEPIREREREIEPESTRLQCTSGMDTGYVIHGYHSITT